MMPPAIALIFQMAFGHALFDYPLQGDFLARGKNHRAPLPGVPWYQCLIAHAMLQAGMVTIITDSWRMGIAEFVCHAVIDYAKCDGKFGFNVDQILHIGCKVAWAVLL